MKSKTKYVTNENKKLTQRCLQVVGHKVCDQSDRIQDETRIHIVNHVVEWFSLNREIEIEIRGVHNA